MCCSSTEHICWLVAALSLVSTSTYSLSTKLCLFISHRGISHSLYEVLFEVSSSINYLAKIMMIRKVAV